MMEEFHDEVPSLKLHIGHITLLGLLLSLCAGTLVLSQLDNQATGAVYGAVSQAFHIDLISLGIGTGQISDAGHSVAGFVLYGFAQLIIRRWWVLPLTLIFFLGLEAAQLLSVQRQASWMDVLRGWGGVVIAWGLVAIGRLFRMERVEGRK